MTIRQLYPPPPEPVQRDGKMCEAIALETGYQRLSNWRQRRYEPRGTNPMCCQRHALYEIDGKVYCAQHAGKIALRRWVAGELLMREKV